MRNLGRVADGELAPVAEGGVVSPTVVMTVAGAIRIGAEVHVQPEPLSCRRNAAGSLLMPVHAAAAAAVVHDGTPASHAGSNMTWEDGGSRTKAGATRRVTRGGCCTSAGCEGQEAIRRACRVVLRSGGKVRRCARGLLGLRQTEL